MGFISWVKGLFSKEKKPEIKPSISYSNYKHTSAYPSIPSYNDPIPRSYNYEYGYSGAQHSTVNKYPTRESSKSIYPTRVSSGVTHCVHPILEVPKTPTSLQMQSLDEYPIPEIVFQIESEGLVRHELSHHIEDLIAQKSNIRTSEQLYIKSYEMMVFFEEVCDKLKLHQYNRNGLQFYRTDVKKEFYFTVQSSSSAELLAFIDDSKMVRFELTPKMMMYGTKLNGKIKRRAGGKIYVEIFNAFKMNTNDTYDIAFETNRIVYQLQHNALDYVKKHKLFSILIDSPIYQHQQLNEWSLTPKSAVAISNLHELNDEQVQAINCIIAGNNRPHPYLLYGPPGTGKTKTVVACIEQIVQTTQQHILVCAQSNAACDEIAERLCKILTKKQMLRMYSASHELDKVSPALKPFCNLFEDKFKYPCLEDLYQYRVLICTLSTSGCLTRARLSEFKFKSDHFGYVFIDECASAHETMSLIPIAGLCTSLNQVHANIVLIGDPKQLDAVTKSEWSKKLGFKVSWFEQLSNLPLYERNEITGKFNEAYITQLIENYRSHKAILKVPNELFYENKLKSMVRPEIIKLDTVCGLLSKNFPIVFQSVQGICRSPPNQTSSCNMEEVDAVMNFIETHLDGIDQKDIGVVSPYKLQCSKIRNECEKRCRADITIGTAEVFQGQEKKVMIISTVRSGKRSLGDFLGNAQRFNVMITRAQSLLIVIGDPHLLRKDQNWNTFIRYCFKKRCLIQSKTYFRPQ